MLNLIEKLKTCYTGIVHDIMRANGYKNFTLPAEIKPLIDGKKICGPAFTIEGLVNPNADEHQTLLEWTGLLSKSKKDYIWVCQPNDINVAFMGELSAETLSDRGVLGCVIDGGIRDTESLINLDFQCFSRFHTPRDIVGYWLPTSFDTPIKIGNVEIHQGDYLLGDRDGLLRIPKDSVEDITEESIIAMNTENLVRTAIKNGVDPQKAYLKYGKF